MNRIFRVFCIIRFGLGPLHYISRKNTVSSFYLLCFIFHYFFTVISISRSIRYLLIGWTWSTVKKLLVISEIEIQKIIIKQKIVCLVGCILKLHKNRRRISFQISINFEQCVLPGIFGPIGILILPIPLF
jgi:hypothetical protein